MSFLGMELWIVCCELAGCSDTKVTILGATGADGVKKGKIAEMSFSGMGSWTAVDMPPPSSVPVVNQTLKRADEVSKYRSERSKSLTDSKCI